MTGRGPRREHPEDVSAALYRAVTANLPETAVTVFDRELRFRLAYGEALRLNGWTSDQVEGKTPRELLPPKQADLLEPLFAAALRGERSSVEWRSVHGDRALLTYVAPVVEGGIVAGVAISVDITERKRSEDASRRLAAIVEQAEDAIVATALDGEITAWNRGAERLLGYEASAAMGRPGTMLVPRDRLAEERRVMRRVADGETVAYETERVRADRSVVAVSVIGSPIRDAEGAVIGTSAIARDITERKRMEEQLEHLATHDPLTGLLNRGALEAELARTAAFARRQRIPGALLVLDLDHFKSVNDSYGHAAGDALLRRVADVLCERLRETDLIGRLGGDEFAIILPGTPTDDARAVAASLLHELRGIQVERQTVPIAATIGIAPIESSARTTPQDLLELADIAMYQAKEAGRDRIGLADWARGREPELVARLGWAERIRDALDNDRFTLQMQPIVDLRTRSVERAELLIRMRGQREELIPPSSFLPVAERFGHIRAIDRWVLDQALALLRRQRRGDALTLHVNLSGATITDPELCNALPARIAREAPVPSRLVLEITETAAIENIAAAQELTGRLAALGCGIALDDFGSGFGSFYYLKHLPFSALKIDGEFVKHITASRADRVTVQAIVDMARGLGKTTVAECVEQEGTLELLRRLHVDFAQGFHLARPTAVPAAPPGAPE